MNIGAGAGVKRVGARATDRRPIILFCAGAVALAMAAAIASAQEPPPAGDLAARLEAQDPRVRRQAVRAAGLEGPRVPEAALARLVALLGDEDRTPEEGAPRTMEGLEADIAPLGDEAAEALANVGKAAVPSLAGALGSASENVRRRAATALELIGPDAAPAVLALLETLRDHGSRPPPRGDVKIAMIAPGSPSDHASLALGRIGAPAVPGLIAALGAEDARTRANAARALGAIGGDAGAALEPLRKLAEKDPSEPVRRAAAAAATRIEARARKP